jgi:hypothetical protein
MIGFISTSVTSSLNHTYYSAVTDLHTFQSTVAHALGFFVFTSCHLATDLNTGSIKVSLNYSQYWCTTTHIMSDTKSSTSSSGHTAVPLELWNSSEVHQLLTPPAYDYLQMIFAVPHKPLVWTYRKHVTWSLSTVVWWHCLCRSVFIKPLPRNRLHNPAVLLFRAYDEGCLSSRCLAMCWRVTIY